MTSKIVVPKRDLHNTRWQDAGYRSPSTLTPLSYSLSCPMPTSWFNFSVSHPHYHLQLAKGP